MPGLFFAKGKMVAAKPEFDRIAHRRPPDNFDLGAVAKAHFQQAPAYFSVAADGKNVTLAPNAELV
jgi:hypothetical protein